MKTSEEIKSLKTEFDRLSKKLSMLTEAELKQVVGGEIVPEEEIDPEIYRRGYNMGDPCPTDDGGTLNYGGLGGTGGYNIYIILRCSVCGRDFAYNKSIY